MLDTMEILEMASKDAALSKAAAHDIANNGFAILRRPKYADRIVATAVDILHQGGKGCHTAHVKYLSREGVVADRLFIFADGTDYDRVGDLYIKGIDEAEYRLQTA